MNRKAGPNRVSEGQRSGGRTADGGSDADPFDYWLEDKLRNAYSSVLEEPIPEDLLKLLQQKLKD